MASPPSSTAAPHATGVVRPFVEQDIAQVSILHRQVFGGARTSDAYRTYFHDVFLRGERDLLSTSLVCERRGRILGFLGIKPRRMLFEGRPVVAAVCSQFLVDRSERGQTGLQLLKHCFAGEHDLTVTDESGDNTRKLWEWCGARTSIPFSLHWVRPLRPFQTAITVAGAVTARTRTWDRIAPLARALDAGLEKLAPYRLVPPQPRGTSAELSESGLASCAGQFGRTRSLMPVYDEASIHWLLQRATHGAGCGQCRKLAIRDESGQTVGYAVYCITKNGAGEVLQIAAKTRFEPLVLDHLLRDAWTHKVTALFGRLEPSFVPQLSERGWLVYRRGSWTLVHSRSARISEAFERGDALFTRLDGEWCLRFV